MPELSYPVPAKEGERLKALRGYQILDTPPEAEFDRIVELAADLLQVPMALISLVEDRRQFLKARAGLDATETSRDVSFCAHALMQKEIFEVPDAQQDARFARNALVTGGPQIRYYAGAPLVDPQGHGLGALCIIDSKVRSPLTEPQRKLLKGLAQLTMDHLERRRLLLLKGATVQMTRATSDAIICIDNESVIRFWNAAAERMFGYARQEAVGRTLDIIIPERFRAAHKKGVQRLSSGGGATLLGKPIEITTHRQDGTEFPVELTLSVWHEGPRMYSGAIIRDISDRRRNEHRLRQLAMFDPLTGLANRTQFGEAVQAADGPMAVALLGIDRFKNLNASFGPGIADEALRQIAARLQVLAQPDSLVARTGGDEFAVLISGTGCQVRAKELADALLTIFARPFEVEGIPLHLGASLGLVHANEPCAEQTDALSCAALALHRAKAEGGGRLVTYEPSMGAHASERRRLEEELRLAYVNGEFELFYQPQIDLGTGEIAGAEALLRWRHPTRGLLAPGAFLATLEAMPLAVQVGSWAIDEACRFAAGIEQGGETPLRIGVNLFAAQFQAGDTVACVERALARHGLAPERLELEITETTALSVEEAMLAPLRRLREIGVGIAFDDYGTGFASLSLLKRYPLTRLKIDREFVRDLGTDPGDQAIVKAVLVLADSLGLDVTAEGIECELHAEFLRRAGCGEAQGYFFGKPMPGPQLAGLLRSGVNPQSAAA